MVFMQPVILLLLSFLFLACGEKTEVTGTTTTTENSIGMDTLHGRVHSSDGSLGALARIYLRGDSVGLDASGELTYLYEKQFHADLEGHFSVLVPKEGICYLEVQVGRDEKKTETFLTRIDTAVFRTDSMEVKLEVPGRLQGRVLFSGSNAWVMHQGSSSFSQVDSNGFFTLEGLYPGDLELRFLLADSGVPSSFLHLVRVEGASVASGKTTLLPAILISEEESIEVSPWECKSSTLFQSENFMAGQEPGFRATQTVGGGLRLLSILPCSGSWTALDTVPVIPAALSLYSDMQMDYLLDGNENFYFRFDTLGQRIPAQNGLEKDTLPLLLGDVYAADIYDGFLYSLRGGMGRRGFYRTSISGTVPTEAWLLLDIASEGATFFPMDFLSVEGRFALAASRDGRYWVRDLVSGQVFVDAIFQSLPAEIRGLVLDEHGRVWVLDGSGRLTLYDMLQGSVLAEFELEGEAMVDLYGLTRFSIH